MLFNNFKLIKEIKNISSYFNINFYEFLYEFYLLSKYK